VLLYGPPGTGKSSYAHGLAREVGLPAFEVLSGEDNRRVTHRGAILACLNMTSHGAGSLVIVDEADRLLSTHGPWYWMSGLVDSDKGWLNYLLERPGVRMIWICNQVDGIDASTRRRFAFSVAFRPFGRRQRLQVWQTVARTHRVRRLLRPEEMQRLASEYRLGAGAIDLAVRTARQTADSSRPAFVQAVRAALESHRTLLNDGERFVEKDRVREDFTLDALNPDGDLEVVLRRLEAVDHALRASPAPGLALGAGVNLLLHGPPGTGKSELARFIADHLDREPLVRRASDLHSKWVGETEQRIARAFAEAEAEDAVLILDEVDTFLFGRDQAQRSWEVSFTNELLTRMERFRGILVCTTNRLEALDPASIRRFQIKLRLGYLTDEGKALLYQQMLAPLCDGAPGAGVPRELERIAPLSAGDFRVVREQIGVEGGVEHGRVVEALRREAALKKKQKRVGFGS
jgi:SpoVK/Ycf46/Vps4 family AAA+-type ATPase